MGMKLVLDDVGDICVINEDEPSLVWVYSDNPVICRELITHNNLGGEDITVLDKAKVIIDLGDLHEVLTMWYDNRFSGGGT